jgi:hypothetical protein
MAAVFRNAKGILVVYFCENKKIIAAVFFEAILITIFKHSAEKRLGRSAALARILLPRQCTRG